MDHQQDQQPLSYITLFFKRPLILCLCVLSGSLWAQTGPVYQEYFYADGSISSKGYLENGRPNGYWTTYYPGGIPKSEGDRKDFELDSLWKFYDAKGRLANTISYVRGLKEGPSEKFDTLGNRISTETYSADRRQGDRVEYHADGSLARITPFVDGAENGTGRAFAPDGRVIEITVHRAGVLHRREQINRIDAFGLKQGPWKEFWPNGGLRNEGTYLDDKLQGIYKEYDVRGNLVNMAKYAAGQEDKNAPEANLLVIRNSYHANGKVSALGSYNKQGRKEGLFRYFDKDGNPTGSSIYNDDVLQSEGSVNDLGMLEGKWVEYHPSGEKRSEGTYAAGKKEGEWIFYFTGGGIEQRGRYQQGLPSGIWKWFYLTGEKWREETYRRGREDGASEEFDREGGTISKGEYIDGLREGVWEYRVGDHYEKGAYKDGARTGPWEHTYLHSGKREFVGTYINGELHGKAKWFWPNGQVKAEGRFVAGAAHGDHNYYGEDGQLRLSIRYRNGAEMRVNSIHLPAPHVAGE